MTEQQKAMVQTSFAEVGDIAEIAAALFYHRLFELDPQLKPLFKGDLTEQGRKLMQMLTLAVSTLDHPETLRAKLQQLGARHIGYGVQPHHYQTVGAALIWTLEQGLGAGFTDEVRAAWTTLYTFVAETMQQAAMAV